MDSKAWKKPLEFRAWLTWGRNRTRAYCKCCDVHLKSTAYSALLKHSETMRHTKAMKGSSLKSGEQVGPSTSVHAVTEMQRKEGQLWLYAAVHSSISSIDHLSNHHNIIAQNVSLNKQKCINALNNVIGPHFVELLSTDIGDGCYSLLIESTDVNVNKMLGIAVRYFSTSQDKIVSTFLALIYVEQVKADCIVKEIKKLLSNSHLTLKNLQGIGIDNPPAMVNVNSRISAILKKELPHLVSLRCVCYSLQLAFSEATKNTLPRCIEFIVKETYNWFAQSPVRSYADVYNAIKDGEKARNIVKATGARWLSIRLAVKRILDNWTHLETHFNNAQTTENCSMAQILYEMYQNGQNKVILSFLYDILELVQKSIDNFESATADPLESLRDLNLLYVTIVKKVVSRTAHINIYTDNIESNLDPNPSISDIFESRSRDLRIREGDKNELKLRCKNFLVSLSKGIQSRLAENIEILEKISLLSVKQCLKPNNTITEIGQFLFPRDHIAIPKIDSQWQAISSIGWNETQDTEKFWDEVDKFRSPNGERSFNELGQLALRALSLPHSNADIERIFSEINLVKSKRPSPSELDLLNHILHIRFGLKRVGKCCKDYVLPDAVLNQLGNDTLNVTTEIDEMQVQDFEIILSQTISLL